MPQLSYWLSQIIKDKLITNAKLNENVNRVPFNEMLKTRPAKGKEKEVEVIKIFGDGQ